MNIKRKIQFYLTHPRHLIRRLIIGPQNIDLDLEYFQKILPVNAVIIEAGAANGMDTEKFGKLFPSGKVFAFEPVPSAFIKLNNQVSSLKNVYTFPVALGPESRQAVLNVIIKDGNPDSTDSSSLMALDPEMAIHFNLSLEKTIQVDVRRLDDIIQEQHITRIDLMWLDMQGFELEMLKGNPAARSITQRIYMEVSMIPGYQNAPTYKIVKNQMKSYGFYPEIELYGPIGGNVLFRRLAC